MVFMWDISLVSLTTLHHRSSIMWQREWRNHDVMRGFLNCFVISCPPPPEGVGRSCVDKLYKVAFVIRSRFAKGIKGGSPNGRRTHLWRWRRISEVADASTNWPILTIQSVIESWEYIITQIFGCDVKIWITTVLFHPPNDGCFGPSDATKGLRTVD